MTEALHGKARLSYIDGLRAIAVGLVVYFHAQLPGIPKGYFGVDIFFVISGFLITAQIVDGIQRGSFSITEFYVRRVLRIWPPLFLVIAVVLIGAASVPLLPADMTRIAGSAIASATMVSNWFFMPSDYFARPAEREPLLHIWSLGVEEQYYLVTPAFILLLALVSRRRGINLYRVALIASLLIIPISLGLAIPFAKSKSNLVFYGTPWRVWEFAVGATASLSIRCGLGMSRNFANAGLLCGLVAIGVACTVVGQDPYGVLLLQALAVLGSGSIVLCGSFAGRGPLTAIMSSRPMVGLGLVSYSFYLWHWPILSFWRLLHLDPTSRLENAMFGIAVPLLLAIVTYFALERPLADWRHSGRLPQLRWRPIAQGAGGAAFICLMALGVVAWSRHLATGSLSAYAAAVKTIGIDCQRGVRARGPLGECRTPAGSTPADARVLLWGDSHARSLWAAVAHPAHGTGMAAQLQWDGFCPPLPGTDLHFGTEPFRDCILVNDTILRWLSAGDLNGVTGVVLGARWEYSLGTVPPGTDPAKLGEAVEHTIHLLNALGIRVLVVGPVPVLPLDAPECNFRASFAGSDIKRCNPRRSDVEAAHGAITAALQAAVRGSRNARFVDVQTALCDSDYCWSGRNGQIYYTDDNHLSNPGALAVLDQFKDDFSWIFGASQRDAAALPEQPGR